MGGGGGLGFLDILHKFQRIINMYPSKVRRWSPKGRFTMNKCELHASVWPELHVHVGVFFFFWAVSPHLTNYYTILYPTKKTLQKKRKTSQTQSPTIPKRGRRSELDEGLGWHLAGHKGLCRRGQRREENRRSDKIFGLLRILIKMFLTRFGNKTIIPRLCLKPWALRCVDFVPYGVYGH